MEGISDGLAVDDCFVCAYLWPTVDSCSECGKTMRYLPAMMVQNFSAALAMAKQDFDVEKDQSNALTLAELIWLAGKYGFDIEDTKLPHRDELAEHVSQRAKKI